MSLSTKRDQAWLDYDNAANAYQAHKAKLTHLDEADPARPLILVEDARLRDVTTRALQARNVADLEWRNRPAWEVSVPDLDSPGEFKTTGPLSRAAARKLAQQYGADSDGRILIVKLIPIIKDDDAES